MASPHAFAKNPGLFWQAPAPVPKTPGFFGKPPRRCQKPRAFLANPYAFAKKPELLGQRRTPLPKKCSFGPGRAPKWQKLGRPARFQARPRTERAVLRRRVPAQNRHTAVPGRAERLRFQSFANFGQAGGGGKLSLLKGQGFSQQESLLGLFFGGQALKVARDDADKRGSWPFRPDVEGRQVALPN